MKYQEELQEFGKRWDQAIVDNDPDKISQFMSDDWVIVGTEGGITSKSDFLQAVRSGDLFHTKMSFEDLHIKVYGDAGVVISRGTSSGTYKGQPFSFYEWSTSTYIRNEGRWQCVLTMLTPAK
jgi:ketosteroid isomerase-like protein